FHSVSDLAFLLHCYADLRDLHSFPTRRSSDLGVIIRFVGLGVRKRSGCALLRLSCRMLFGEIRQGMPWSNLQQQHVALAEQRLRSEEHTSELQSRSDLVCRLLLEKKKQYWAS